MPGNSAKNFEFLLGVLRGKLTLEPPHMLPDTFFPAGSGFWVLWGKIYALMKKQ